MVIVTRIKLLDSPLLALKSAAMVSFPWLAARLAIIRNLDGAFMAIGIMQN